MKAEARELYVYTKDQFQEELSALNECGKSIIGIRQVVNKAMRKYVIDHCSNGTKFEDIFSTEDFKEVSNKIYEDMVNSEL